MAAGKWFSVCTSCNVTLTYLERNHRCDVANSCHWARLTLAIADDGTPRDGEAAEAVYG